ncbi:MAG TPA: hypothetical protein VFE62_00480 [Gemmataceae bacterium]|nr:hypothetical protein [Gemmataceae bacterium]
MDRTQSGIRIEGADALAWMDPDADPESMAQLLRPFNASKMVAFPIGQAVGKVKNHGATLIEPFNLDA